METKYAGFWWRFLAYLIDYAILSIFSLIALIPFIVTISYTSFIFSLSELADMESTQLIGSVIGTYMLAILLIIAAGWLYYALMESSKYQATPGKMAIGLKVTDANGNRITFGRATGRYFGKILSGLILLVGYIMAGFTSKKQALHDIIADTLVVKTDASIEKGEKYAGFWLRFVAYLIDTALVTIFELITLIPFFILLGYTSLKFSTSSPTDLETMQLVGSLIGTYLLALLLIIAANWLYHALMESSKLQATLGKRALGLIVTDLQGNRLSFGRATGRFFAKFLSGLLFCIGYIIAGFTEKKQALHDFIAETLVWKKSI